MITNVTLTTKEKFLLEDMKSHEEQCILKYDNYYNLASDPQLKAVFRTNAQIEREHLESINQLLNGKVPNMSGGQSGGQQSNTQQSSANQPQQQSKSGLTTFAQESTSSWASIYLTKICVWICFLLRNMCLEPMIPLYLNLRMHRFEMY